MRNSQHLKNIELAQFRKVSKVWSGFKFEWENYQVRVGREKRPSSHFGKPSHCHSELYRVRGTIDVN